jgi:hypothetical protein
MVKSGAPRALYVILLTMAGNRDDERAIAAVLRPEALHDLVTIHARQADIQQHDFRVVSPGYLNGSVAVMGNSYVVSE